MFGIGGDDKDKLKENMDEIKQMVNNSTPGEEDEKEKEMEELEQQFQQTSDSPSDSKAETFDGSGQNDAEQADRSFDKTFGADQSGQTRSQGTNEEAPETSSFDQAPQQPQNRSAGQTQNAGQEQNNGQAQNAGQAQNTQSDMKQQPQQDQSQMAQSPQQTSQRNDNRNQQSQQDRSSRQQMEEAENPDRSDPKTRSGSDLGGDIPEPAETKQINVPEIDKGPLFIRQKKFESARNMIKEMRYIADEIEGVVNQLERGIEEDRKTERDAKELLQRLKQDRSEVNNIISSEGKE